MSWWPGHPQRGTLGKTCWKRQSPQSLKKRDRANTDHQHRTSSDACSSANPLDVSESSVSLERDSSEDTTPSDGSDAPRRQNQAAVAEAALQDVETLHQLIFRDLEDGWSQDSEDTPTNETANERSPITDIPGAQLPDPAPRESPGQWGEEPVEAPPLEVLHSPVQVVRKVLGAGCSLPDDITDDVTAGQSSRDGGNMFYLVMPKDQWSALTGH